MTITSAHSASLHSPPPQLLPTALRTSKSRPSVRREALLNRLSSIEADVITLTSPAGYGKSTLLAQWADAEAGSRRFAWVNGSVGADPSLTLAYFAAALHEVSGLPMSRSASLATICQAIESTETAIVIVLDGAELLSNGQCASILGAVADHLPAGSQLVVSGRQMPSMPFARLRAEDRLVELTAADLALTDTEARDVVSALGHEPSEETIVHLIETSEGWAAGLRLALRAAQGDGNLSSFLADYLRSEWLAALPATDRRVLTHGAVANPLPAGMCDELVDQPYAGRTLDRLSQHGGFLVAMAGDSFRFHVMVRGFLVAELEREHPGASPSLQRKAATWYQEHGSPEMAMKVALAACDHDHAVELATVSAPSLYHAGDLSVVEGWLDRLAASPSTLTHSPLVVLATWAHAVGGRFSDAQDWASTIERTRDADAVASRLLVRAVRCRLGIDQMHRDAAAAIEQITPSSDLAPLGTTLLGWAQLLGNDPDGADATLADAATSALARSFPDLAALATTGRALCALDLSRWELADALCQDALRLVGEGGLAGYATSAITHAVAGRIACHRGDHTRALEHADRSAELLKGLTPAIPWLSVRTRVETARLSLAVGRPEAALDLCDEILSVLRTCPTLDSRPTSELKLQALFGSKGDPWAATLSRAELRVLPLLASHLTFAEMAKKLFVSRNTVKSQAISIYRKLGVSTRNEAVMRAAQLGLMSSSFTDAGTHSNGNRPSAHAAR